MMIVRTPGYRLHQLLQGELLPMQQSGFVWCLTEKASGIVAARRLAIANT